MQAGYSFAASTVLSTWLWTRLTSANVLVTFITDDIGEQEALFLQGVLSDLGAHVSIRKVLKKKITPVALSVFHPFVTHFFSSVVSIRTAKHPG